MIQFDALKFDLNKNLIIRVSVPDKEYFDNVHISGIYIDTQDSFLLSGPSSNPVYKYELDKEDDSKYKTLELIVPNSEILANIQGNVFFVWATTTGNPKYNTPCGFDVPLLVKWVVDLLLIYQKIIPLLKELDLDCSYHRNFNNMFLRYKAFQYSMNSGDYSNGIAYWNKFFTNTLVESLNRRCSCYGKSI